MKGKRELIKNLSAGVWGLTITLLLLVTSAQAQNNNNASAQQDNRTTTTQTETRRADNRQEEKPDRDWGWLGLLGLGGLLGLMPRKRVPVVHQANEPRDVRPGAPTSERR